ncbi:hypothetical protein B0H98_103257 [Vreelandella songnenensis]|uniref:DUF1415 domain-containing protein n=1 Tax=Vreelandella songnenensis TaxID=1176243 RepID=A0A2T0V577_9GAMM|nr:DUF1415 domain-containing protein [Halomonas songnenensis]PRY65314.1 hypothetical protein B0H98_103257 [Halomonas songnenensis]
MQYSDEVVSEQTLNWVRTFIVAHNICPFAQREIERATIRVEVVRSKKLEVALEELMAEVQWLDEHPETETTLLVFPTLFKDFEHYLDYVELAESILAEQGYEGIYQLATFHPDYCFDGAEPDDASNYTNRSPYAMVHLLREASVEKAIEFYGDTSTIPERNIEHLTAMGCDEAERHLQAALALGEQKE